MPVVNVDYTNRHDRSFTDDAFKVKEIEKYETKYPGLKIIRPEYRTEDALEDDWLAFSSLPYHLRVVADEKALFLFGKKNEEIYKMIKTKFLQNESSNSRILFNQYKPSKLIESDVFLDPINNVYIIDKNINDLDTLNSAWEAYLGQDDDQKETSDSISFARYGKTVPEIYNELLKTISNEEINNSNYNFLNNYSPPTNMAEAFMTELDYIVTESNDIIEKLIFLKQMNNRVNTPVLKTLTEELQKDIGKRLLNENLFNIPGANFFLPEEIMGICENTNELKTDKMFLNYASRFYGIQPYRGFMHEANVILSNSNTSEFDKIKLGWNPVMEEYTNENILKSHQRSMNILNENVNCNFIPLYNSKEVNYDDKFKKGLSMVTIYESDRNHTVHSGIPRVLVSFNCFNEDWYQFAYSQLMTKLNLNQVLSEYKEPLVDCYFLEMDESLYNERLTLVSRFNLIKNSLTEFTSLLNESTPNINNSKLFTYRFINGLLESNHIYKKDYSIYHLLSEFNVQHRDIINSHKKLAIIDQFNKYDNDSNYLTEIFNIHIIKEATSLPIEFDDDGNLFIKKKENIDFAAEYQQCHKLLKQYEKVENYEAMKYYVAKLWYMNILLEKKIHQKNKNELMQEKLPEYYKARAHILNDFNVYMSKILQHEPEFDFQEYYENTPFNTSIIKVSKNLLKQIWDTFRTLIFGT